MNIEQIAKQYTREEFVNLLTDSDYGNEDVNIFNTDYSCPSDFKLVNIAKNIFCCNQRCKECWTNAIKDVKFKDEIQEDKKNKEYSASELIHIIEENKLNDDVTIIDKENNEYTFSDAIDNWDLEGLIQFAPYKIKSEKIINLDCQNIWYMITENNKPTIRLLSNEYFYMKDKQLYFNVKLFIEDKQDITEYPNEFKSAYCKYLNTLNKNDYKVLKGGVLTDRLLYEMGYIKKEELNK